MSTTLDIQHCIEGAAAYGITLDDIARERLLLFYSELLEWNGRMNLVSKADMERFSGYHVLDSLKIAPIIDFPSIRRILDFGSGAGLPGIPLAIAFPHLEVTLVDSKEKRCSFLDHIVNLLPGLDITVMRSRIEDVPTSHNRKFNCVVTRGTTSLVQFAFWCERFVGRRGKLCSIKGDNIKNELSDLKTCSLSSVFNISSTIPESVTGVRSGTVVVMRKR